MIYAVIPKSLSPPKVMESVNQDLIAINSWCLKWHMRLNPEMKFMVLSWSRAVAPGYSDLTHGGAELEELKGFRIIGVTLDSELTFETRLLEVVSEAARILRIAHEQESHLVVYLR